MPLTATNLRANIYAILDQVLATGEAVEIERNGRMLRLQPVEVGSRLDRLIQRPETIIGDPDDIVEFDWLKDWSELAPSTGHTNPGPSGTLYELAKTKSALEGRSVREVATALFTGWVSGAVPADPTVTLRDVSSESRWLSAFKALGADVAKATGGEGGLTEQLNADRR